MWESGSQLYGCYSFQFLNDVVMERLVSSINMTAIGRSPFLMVLGVIICCMVIMSKLVLGFIEPLANLIRGAQK